MRFFHLNFLNARGILVQGVYNAYTMFHQFSEIKNGGRSQQTSVLSQLVNGESSAQELVVLRKAKFIFQ